MGEETIKKLHAHFSKLSVEGGNTDNAIRNQLIKEDALRHKTILETKRYKPNVNIAKELWGELCYPYLTEGVKNTPKGKK